MVRHVCMQLCQKYIWILAKFQKFISMPTLPRTSSLLNLSLFTQSVPLRRSYLNDQTVGNYRVQGNMHSQMLETRILEGRHCWREEKLGYWLICQMLQNY